MHTAMLIKIAIRIFADHVSATPADVFAEIVADGVLLLTASNAGPEEVLDEAWGFCFHEVFAWIAFNILEVYSMVITFIVAQILRILTFFPHHSSPAPSSPSRSDFLHNSSANRYP